MVTLARRGFLLGLVSALAAPAIVRAGSIMPVRSLFVGRSGRFLTTDMLTRESVKLWPNSNNFIRGIDEQFEEEFGRAGAKIGSSIRIRLPSAFMALE